MDTVEFFRTVLPAQGIYYAVAFNGKGFSHLPCDSVEKLAQTVSLIEQKGHAAYFACASYKQKAIVGNDKPKFRVPENQLAAKSFWIDLDCGASKAAKGDGYASKQEAAQALNTFLGKVKLPQPIVVDSGNGLHAYWPLDTELDRTEWKRTAEVLKQLFAYHNLKADPTRTADFASILRPPGTFNRKDPQNPKQVRIRLEQRPIRYSEFYAVINNAILNSDITLPKPVATNDSSINKDLLAHAYPEIPVSAALVAEKCGVVQRMRDTKGDVGYETWRGVIGIIKHCEEGLPLAKEWSSRRGETRDQVDVEAKFNTWNSGPATCAHFQKQNEPACQGCKFKDKVTSPIQLGRKMAENKAVEMKVESHGQQLVVEVPALPKRYRFENGLLSIYKQDADGLLVAEPFLKNLLYCTGEFKDESGKFHIALRAHKTGEVVEKVVTYNAANNINTMMETLGGEFGLSPLPGAEKVTMGYLREEIQRIQVEAKAQTMRRSFGWDAEFNGFLLGNTYFHKDGSQRVVSVAGNALKFVGALSPIGSLSVWQQTVATVYAQPGMEAFQYSILSMLGSPLVKFVHKEFFGLPVMLSSADSGKGKTTAAWAGISAYGYPEGLLVNGADGSTEKARTLIMSTMGDLPILFDEFTNVKTEELSKLLYAASNGKERIRILGGSTDPTLSSSPTWCLNSLITANKYLTGSLVVDQANSRAESLRAIEFKVDREPIPQIESNLIDQYKNDLVNNSGQAGRVFVQWIVTHQDEAKAVVAKWSKRIGEDKAFAGSEYRFYRHHISVTMAAGEIAAQLGLITFDLSVLFDWTKVAVIKRIDEVNRLNITGGRDAFALMLRDLSPRIVMSVEYRQPNDARGYELVEMPRGGSQIGRIVRGSQKAAEPEYNGKMWLVKREVMHWCGKNRIDLESLLEDARKDGVYLGEEQFLLGRGTGLPSARSECYVFSWDKLQEEPAKPVTNLKVVGDEGTEVRSVDRLKAARAGNWAVAAYDQGVDNEGTGTSST